MRKAVVGMCVGVTLASTAWPGDWPEWRGEGRTGKSSETGLLQAWLDAGPKQVWKIEGIGGGYSTNTVSATRERCCGSASSLKTTPTQI